MGTTAENAVGTFLIGEGAWSIFLKDQVNPGYVKLATAGRLARIGIGAFLIAKD